MQTLEITPAVLIPEHLTGEIQSKLAYVDELILDADVSTDLIILSIRDIPGESDAQLSPKRMALIEEKVGRVGGIDGKRRHKTQGGGAGRLHGSTNHLRQGSYR